MLERRHPHAAVERFAVDRHAGEPLCNSGSLSPSGCPGSRLRARPKSRCRPRGFPTVSARREVVQRPCPQPQLVLNQSVHPRDRRQIFRPSLSPQPVRPGNQSTPTSSEFRPRCSRSRKLEGIGFTAFHVPFEALKAARFARKFPTITLSAASASMKSAQACIMGLRSSIYLAWL